MSSDKEATLSLSQISLRFLADNNSWNENGTPQNREAVTQDY